jgi:carotenoid cleavage dioxygenase-like enzyme
MTEQKKQVDLPWHLRGNWAPVFDELTVTDLKVDGRIPPELNGRYLRAGMNPRSGVSEHWFFGNGMVHGVELRDGAAVSYRNRFVRTPYYEQDMDVMTGMSDLNASPANTSIFRHAGRILALEEAHRPWQITPDLDTVGPVDFDGKLQTPMTAHPRICPETGEMMFFAYTFFNASTYLTYHRADAEGNLVQTEAIEIPRPVMMHDWNVTRNNVVFMDMPLCFALEKGGFHWAPEHGARLGVMPRAGSNADVKWYDIDPCYVFHPLNSYEDGDKIVFHVARMAQAMTGGMSDIGGDLGRLWKWTLDTKSGSVKEEQMDDRPADFCRIDDRHVGLKARYGYMMALVPNGDGNEYGEELYKYDLKTGECMIHALGDGVKGGEPVFAPRSPDAEEDDGWIMAVVHDEPNGKSKLVIIDARDFTGAPVAQVHLPQRVPYGAHGNWLAD